MIFFAFEYMILTLSIVSLGTQSLSVHLSFIFSSTGIKFALNLFDQYMEGRWESKSVVFLYLDFVIDVFQLTVYVYVILFNFY